MRSALLSLLGVTLMAQDISGTWRLAGVDATIELTFDEASKSLKGFSGCNRFHTSYTIKGDQIEIHPFALTRKMCPPPLMRQEDTFIATLSQSRGYLQKDDNLKLLDAKGAVLLEFTLK